jgi:hypothetical protein
MKNRLICALVACLLPGVLFAEDQVDYNPRGQFYLKEKIKPFFSVKGDVRMWDDEFIDYTNGILFERGWGNTRADSSFMLDRSLSQYGLFESQDIGMHFEAGVQYEQLVTWMDINWTMPQTSEKPADENTFGGALRDVKFFTYGADFMVGYMLAPPSSRINLIPAVGGGFSLYNVKFASNYEIYYGGDGTDDNLKPYFIQDRYYSTLGKTINAELELRLNLASGLSVGGYGGYRFGFYDGIVIERSDREDPHMTYFIGSTSFSGHAYFFGGKLTYTLPSIMEKEAEKFRK